MEGLKYQGHIVGDWQKYVGKRCIVREDRPVCSIMEVKVVEVSPKGRVKFEFPSDHRRWLSPKEYILIEDLGV